MSLDPGRRLGPYEIVEPLGAGGMGEVYRARDTRLGREVAIKVLPDHLAADPEALARFEREAQTVAALTHPNILALHDFGSDGEARYAVTELLAGETLRERLERGPLPPRKTAEIGTRIARGLAAAHEKGVVHRDLKPENLFLTRDGQVKILDFGLARSGGPTPAGDATQSPTLTRHTDPGTVLGTAGYMAPEQVRGEEADHRADIFALGAVLYEMLTGRRAFLRDTAVETMAAILREDPPEPDGSGASVPEALAQIIRRCLEKQRGERFQSARDLAFALAHAVGQSSASRHASAMSNLQPSQRLRNTLRSLALLAAGVAVGALTARLLAPSVPAPQPVKIGPLTFSGQDFSPDVSPDGRTLAFVSTRDGTARIWLMDRASGGEEALTDGPDGSPRFSPDGGSLLFPRQEGSTISLYRQGLVGRQVRKLIDDAVEGDWSPDGRQIAFLRPTLRSETAATIVGLALADGSEEHTLTELSGTILGGIRWSPDGKRLAVVAGTATNNRGAYLLLIDAASGRTTPVEPRFPGSLISTPVWSAQGTGLVYARSESTMGGLSDAANRIVRHDLASGRVHTLFWARDLFLTSAVSPPTLVEAGRGALAFDTIHLQENLEAINLTSATRSPPRPITAGSSIDRQPTFSPDGRTVLFSSNRGGTLDLWTLELESGAVRRLTDDPADDWDPAYMRDGSQLLWSSNRSGNLEIWIAEADGSHARQLTHDGVNAENPTATPDAAWILYSTNNPAHPGIWKIRPDGRDATRLVPGTFFLPDTSPDGRHVLFAEARVTEGRNLLRVAETAGGALLPFRIEIPLSLVGQSLTITAGRGRWLPDGSGIVYSGVDEAGRLSLYLQDFALEASGAPAAPKPLLTSRPGAQAESFGISPDGSRLVVAYYRRTSTVMLVEGVPGVGAPQR